MNNIIGVINERVIQTLNLEVPKNTPIFIGEANIEHIKNRHLEDYNKYGKFISDIIKNPTYLARDERKKSIEYIKKYIINKEMVLVVVRATGNNKFFVRTMYTMSNQKVEKYKVHGYLKELD